MWSVLWAVHSGFIHSDASLVPQSRLCCFKTKAIKGQLSRPQGDFDLEGKF